MSRREHYAANSRAWLVSLLLGLASTLALAVGAQTVFAGHAGGCPLAANRCAKHGYASDAAFPAATLADQVMSTGSSVPTSTAGMPVSNVNEFVSRINSLLFNTSAGAANLQDRIGAAFIVNTMLGHPGSDFIDQNGSIINARNRFGDWEARVRFYNNNGRVDWNFSQSYPANFINSAYGPSISDNFFYVEKPAITVPSIIFKNTDGTPRYMIKKNCGNPAGTILPLDTPPPGTPPPPSVPPTPPPPPPLLLSCIVLTTIPSQPQPDEPFKARVRITNNGGEPYTGGSANMSITPAVNSGAPQSIAIPDIGGGASRTIISGDVTAEGRGYTVTWNITGGNAAPTSCPEAFKVMSKPYFRVYGGDVLAGAPAWGNPGFMDNQTIIGWNKGFGGGFGGAGTQLAAFAMKAINYFSSASARSVPGPPPEPPKGLSFANTSGTYGGDFDGAFYSVYYFAGPPAGVTPSPGNTTINTTILNPGTTTTYYVNGNVRINGNITYNTGGWSFGNVPFFRVIATGNIYIDKSVSSLSGLYIAKGTIYTCANGFSAVAANPAFHSNCNTKLTVNGAFIAKQLKLRRTTGTLFNSINSGEGSATPHIGEVFQFSPELYLAPPSTPDPNLPDYDAITSLPPVL